MELVQQIVAFHMQVLNFLDTLNLHIPDASFYSISVLDNCVSFLIWFSSNMQ